MTVSDAKRPFLTQRSFTTKRNTGKKVRHVNSSAVFVVRKKNAETVVKLILFSTRLHLISRNVASPY